MIVIAPNTVWNPAALETRRIPKKMLGRVAVLPRQRLPRGTWVRLVLEGQFLRFSLALSPFIAAMLIWPEAALPISQAPIAMLILVGIVEMKLLRVPREKRAALVEAAVADRTLDTLRFRARKLLSKIAARRGLNVGDLHLVVEQSELARITPMTLVSVQQGGARPILLSLDDEECGWLHSLFDADLTERALHLANLREDVFLRDTGFDARGVSAHARLAALIDGATPA